MPVQITGLKEWKNLGNEFFFCSRITWVSADFRIASPPKTGGSQ
jgi:hypothetical protein